MIRRIRDADVNLWQLHLDDIPHQDLQLPLFGLALHTLGHLGRHPGVQLNTDAFLRLFQDAHSQITGSWSHFEDRVRGLEEGLVDDRIADTWVFEDVLAHVRVELEDVVAGCCFARLGGAVVGRSAGAGALGGFYLGHVCCVGE